MFIVMMVGLHRGTATNEIPSLFANGVINGMGVKMLLPNSVSMLTHTNHSPATLTGIRAVERMMMVHALEINLE